jgi:alkylhydroperoxidase/carboxymuconolactone decarboxylase family protein YurZ
MATEDWEAKASVTDETKGPWDAALEKLREWDPAWAEQCVKMTTNPWTEGILPRKFIELVYVGLNAACTNLNPDGIRRHIRGAIAAGANREEILFVLKFAALMSFHSCLLGAPILLEEASVGATSEAGSNRARSLQKVGGATPAIDKMKALGQWNEEWDILCFFAPVWTDQFIATGIAIYASGVLPPKEVELLSIAFDASNRQPHTPDTRRHIKKAMKAGATVEEIMEVLKLCVVQGVQACNIGVPILAEELERNAASQTAKA